LAWLGISISPHSFTAVTVEGLSVANKALSVSTVILTSLLIATRIINVSHNSKGALLTQGQPSLRTVVEIIIESAAVYSIAALVFVIGDALATVQLSAVLWVEYASIIFQNMAVRPPPLSLTFIFIPPQIIAPTVIILRVTFGQARPEAEWSNSGRDTMISSLHFNRVTQSYQSARGMGDQNTTVTDSAQLVPHANQQ
jgi:hypothetical protein